MKRIYSLWPSGDFCSLIINESDVGCLAGVVNRRDWRLPEMAIRASFEKSTEGGEKLPDLAILNNGSLAVRAECASILFNGVVADVNLVPLRVGETAWFLVSCLSSVNNIDEGRSSLMRGINGEIFMVLRLCIANSTVPDLFTLDGSNHAQIFATNEFVTHVTAAGLAGISFEEIGEAPA